LSWRKDTPHSEDNPPSWLRISVTFYKEEQEAVGGFLSYSSGYAGTRIKNDNHTEAMLSNSRMITTTDTLLLPDDERYIRSDLRLGNASISLTEHQHKDNLDDTITSEFIKLLCELLMELGPKPSETSEHGSIGLSLGDVSVDVPDYFRLIEEYGSARGEYFTHGDFIGYYKTIT